MPSSPKTKRHNTAALANRENRKSRMSGILSKQFFKGHAKNKRW